LENLIPIEAVCLRRLQVIEVLEAAGALAECGSIVLIGRSIAMKR